MLSISSFLSDKVSDVWRSSRRLLRPLLVLLAVFSLPAFAANERLSYAQTPNRHVLLTLAGDIPFCDASLGGFLGSPVFSVSANRISVSSMVVAGECTPPSVIPPPTPYALTVDLGPLPNGTYLVTWTFLDAFSLPPSSFRYSFDLVNVPEQIPVSTPSGSPTLGTLVLLVGILAIRSSQRATIRRAICASSA